MQLECATEEACVQGGLPRPQSPGAAAAVGIAQLGSHQEERSSSRTERQALAA